MNDIKILIVDDHQVITDGLKSLLNGVDGISVKETASNGKEAVHIIDLLTIDVVLMDIDMPVMDGLTATKLIKQKRNAPGIIILSMHSEKGMVEELIGTGVDGYLLKNSGKEEIVNAIKKVASGSQYFSPDVTLALITNKQSASSSSTEWDLTERELEILGLIADGFTNKEIGERLFISHRTVDTHRTNMMKKLGVNNVAGLINFAIKNRIIT